MAQSYAQLFSPKVAERFTRASQVDPALTNDYTFTGVRTVNVYTIPTVALSDYNRTGAGASGSLPNRYGTPSNLEATTQALTVTKDRSFSLIIDKGDKNETQMVLDAGKALSRQVNERIVPEFDTYVFSTIAKGAGATSATAATKSNAYELFMAGQEALSNANVPDEGRIAFCSYKFAGLLHQSVDFMQGGDKAQQIQISGDLGMVDGVRLIRVPSSRLPSKTASGATTGADFILIHPAAIVAPKRLEEYKIHDDPPGISGWLVEGRFIYDCFVLEALKGSIYYQGPAA